MVLFFSVTVLYIFLFVFICFLLGVQLGNTKTKTQRKSPIQQLVHGSTAGAFQSCPGDPMLVVNIKRTVDMSPLKRIRLRSHAASEFEGERIDVCSRAVF